MSELAPAPQQPTQPSVEHGFAPDIDQILADNAAAQQTVTEKKAAEAEARAAERLAAEKAANEAREAADAARKAAHNLKRQEGWVGSQTTQRKDGEDKSLTTLKRQAATAKSLKEYRDSRPTDVETSRQARYDHYDASAPAVDYESMTPRELMAQYADAYKHKDRTLQNDLRGVVAERAQKLHGKERDDYLAAYDKRFASVEDKFTKVGEDKAMAFYENAAEKAAAERAQRNTKAVSTENTATARPEDTAGKSAPIDTTKKATTTPDSKGEAAETTTTPKETFAEFGARISDAQRAELTDAAIVLTSTFHDKPGVQFSSTAEYEQLKARGVLHKVDQQTFDEYLDHIAQTGEITQFDSEGTERLYRVNGESQEELPAVEAADLLADDTEALALADNQEPEVEPVAEEDNGREGDDTASKERYLNSAEYNDKLAVAAINFLDPGEEITDLKAFYDELVAASDKRGVTNEKFNEIISELAATGIFATSFDKENTRPKIARAADGYFDGVITPEVWDDVLRYTVSKPSMSAESITHIKGLDPKSATAAMRLMKAFGIIDSNYTRGEGFRVNPAEAKGMYFGEPHSLETVKVPDEHPETSDDVNTAPVPTPVLAPAQAPVAEKAKPVNPDRDGEEIETGLRAAERELQRQAEVKRIEAELRDNPDLWYKDPKDHKSKVLRKRRHEKRIKERINEHMAKWKPVELSADALTAAWTDDSEADSKKPVPEKSSNPVVDASQIPWAGGGLTVDDLTNGRGNGKLTYGSPDVVSVNGYDEARRAREVVPSAPRARAASRAARLLSRQRGTVEASSSPVAPSHTAGSVDTLNDLMDAEHDTNA